VSTCPAVPLAAVATISRPAAVKVVVEAVEPLAK
jgi:hypothetical protein